MRHCFLKSFVSTGLLPHKFGVCFSMGLILGVASFPLSGLAQQTHTERQSQHHKGKERHHRSHITSSNLAPPNQQTVNAAQQSVSNPSTATGNNVAAIGGVAAAGATAQPQPAAIPSTAKTNNIASNETPSVPGQNVPRFASLRADEVNMRAGPGTRYPIVWTYHRRGMPVKILRDFDIWRLVEDPDGQKGWIQQAILSGSRSFIIIGSTLSVAQPAVQTQKNKKSEDDRNVHTDSIITGYIATPQAIEQDQNTFVMRESPDATSTPVAVLKSGAIGHIKECPTASEWCKVSVKGYTGWLPRNSFWGLLPQEIIQKS